MFSVIIPLYNKEKYIDKTLQMLVSQLFVDFEIIIVNDGSTDRSLQIVEVFDDPRIRIFSQENQGVSVARNRGITEARNEYICFLDADDIWEIDFLQNMADLIGKFKNYKVFSSAVEIDTGTEILPATYSLSEPFEHNIFIGDFFDFSQKFCILFTSCAVFHRSVFDKSGFFDEKVKSGQDTDLWIRIGLHFEIIFLNEILCTYVFDPESLSKKKIYKGIKLPYQKYENQEVNNPKLKLFLDANRYSEALTNKLLSQNENVKKLKNNIDYKNLNYKQKFLLFIPNFLLRFLLSIQPIFIKLGIRKTVFK